MGEINLSIGEKDARSRIVYGDLSKIIDQAIRNESAYGLHHLQLDACGPYVSAQLHAFQRSLVDYSRAKAPSKRAATREELQRVGSRLTNAVMQMQRRMEQEEKEGELFHVDDDILHPTLLSDRLNIRVSYRCRKSINDQWTYGSITFSHVIQTRSDLQSLAPKHKPSAVKREQDPQEKRYRAWEDLKRTALYSVRNYFRSGGDGSVIPETFQAVVDSYSGCLNNNSAKFWPVPPKS